MSEKLWPFEFKDTGISVLIRKVSPLLAVELRREYPPPTPPLQEVVIGDEKIQEANPADPDYLKALNEYGEEFEKRTRELLVKRGVVIPDDNTTWKEEVNELREFWRNEYGKELGKDDKLVYIAYIAVGTMDGYSELIQAITQRSQPTEAAIAAARDSFPGTVPG